MKSIKLTGLLLAILIINSCTNEEVIGLTRPHEYNRLYLSFQDILGNDLIKDLALNYGEWGTIGVGTLQIEYPNEFMDPFISISLNPGMEMQYPRIIAFGTSLYTSMPRANGFELLAFFPTGTNSFWGKDPLPPAEMITYKVNFPDLFGNNNVHEFVTYWRVYGAINNYRRSYCYRIVFNNKEYFPTRYLVTPPGDDVPEWGGCYYSVVTIVLDRD
jgi:hypothetical protein